MEAAENIATSSTATAKKQLTINDLDDDSLGMIFNKLPFIDRVTVESICKRWYSVSEASWCTYSKCLLIGEDKDNFLYPDNNTIEKKLILEKILQRTGPYLEEITIPCCYSFYGRSTPGTIKWFCEFCPNLKRLSTGALKMNVDDWLACSNLESLRISLYTGADNNEPLGELLHINKRLRRLEITHCSWLKASVFEHLNPGQLQFLEIELCRRFEFTAEVADKLADSLVELKYSLNWGSTCNFEHLGKLKNLRSLDLTIEVEWINIEYIDNIAKNGPKLECLFLSISAVNAYAPTVFAPLFDLPSLRKLVIIVDEDNMPLEERDRLSQSAPHIKFFVVDTLKDVWTDRAVQTACRLIDFLM